MSHSAENDAPYPCRHEECSTVDYCRYGPSWLDRLPWWCWRQGHRWRDCPARKARVIPPERGSHE